MIEIWKDIVGYEGLYQVSNTGKVKCCEKRKGTNYSVLVKETIKICNDDGNGYSQYHLSKNAVKKTYKGHRLVAVAFIPNPDNLREVNHIDGNKYNNTVSNLEWCDKSHNERHCYKIGLKFSGEKNVLSKKIGQFSLAGTLIKVFPNARFVQKEMGFHDSVIRRCARGVINTAYKYKWQYL